MNFAVKVETVHNVSSTRRVCVVIILSKTLFPYRIDGYQGNIKEQVLHLPVF